MIRFSFVGALTKIIDEEFILRSKSKIRKASDVKTPRGETVHVPEKRVVSFSVGSELKEKALTKIDSEADNSKKAAVKKSTTKPKKVSKAKK